VSAVVKRDARAGGPWAPGRAWLLAATLSVALPSLARAQGPEDGLARTDHDTPGERLPVREVALANGMTVLLLPRPASPTVSFVMRIGVGGVHEHLGTTGTAHLLEHMLFKGTESIGTTDYPAERLLFREMDRLHGRLLEARGAGDTATEDELARRIAGLEDEARQYVVSNEYDRILTRAGAQGLNATTDSEATTYFVELPANRVELFFALESDRMANPVFREFYSERDVVMEERRMRVESSAAGALYEAHLATAWTVHPYGQPVVGWMSDLETLRREDVRRYYQDYYGPNNAVLAIVGGFDVDQVEVWARRYLEPIPRGQEPAPVLAVEPEQRGERRVEVEWDAQPHVRIGWHVPAVTHADAPALALLSAILTGGRTSWLHRRLVTQDRAAVSVYSSMGPGSLYPRLFQLDVTPRSPTTTSELEATVYDEIARFVRDGPSETEVSRVQTQIAAGSVRRIQSNLGLAFQLAESSSMHGDWRSGFRASARLADVTPEEIRAAAARYLTKSNRTVATLVAPGGP